MIHFISECICNDAQFHGTETVKRVDLVYYQSVFGVDSVHRDSQQSEMILHGKATHTTSTVYTTAPKSLFAATDEPYMHTMHTHTIFAM